jgi:hypothetical protein
MCGSKGGCETATNASPYVRLLTGAFDIAQGIFRGSTVATMKRSCAREEVMPLKGTISFSIPTGEGSVASFKLPRYPVDPIRARDRFGIVPS